MLTVYSEVLSQIDRQLRAAASRRTHHETAEWAIVVSKAYLFQLAVLNGTVPVGEDLTKDLLRFRLYWMECGRPEANWLAVFHHIQYTDRLKPNPVELLSLEINQLITQNYVEPHCTLMSLINNSFFVSRMFDLAGQHLALEPLNATGT